MPTKKQKTKILKHRTCLVARVTACASFLILAIIAVSSLVRAMSLEQVSAESGIPASWQAASLRNPESITVGIEYWDQKQDDCDDPNRQFEWVMCGLSHEGATQGIIKDHLSAHGHPIPKYTNSEDSAANGIPQLSNNVTGHDPTLPTDNFYRWYHEVEGKSKYMGKYDLTFKRTGENVYTYRGVDNFRDGFFPLDGLGISGNDTATLRYGHNFHFTAHMRIGVRIENSGFERFDFHGDDDVWVFLNNQLILDIGGLHTETPGHFTIDSNGIVTAVVENVDTGGRHTETVTKTIDTGLKNGDVVNLDFFYAERSTTASNNKITITGMTWPISSEADVQGEIVGKNEDANTNIIKYTSSLQNRDTSQDVSISHIAAHVTDQPTDSETAKTGFLPLSDGILKYTTTPEDDDSWQTIGITAPSNDLDGFKLDTPIKLNPAGEEGDTAYFQFFAETDPGYGDITMQVDYYTELGGAASVAYDKVTLPYGSAPAPDPCEDSENYELCQACQDAEDPDGCMTPPQTYTVVIKYVDADDNEIADSHTGTYYDDETVTISSPDISGYILRDPENDSEVNLKVTGEDIEYKVYYDIAPTPEPDPVTITIKYVDSDHNELIESTSSTHLPGSKITFTSPAIEGYTVNADQAEITYTVPDSDDTIYIIYTKKPASNPTPGGSTGGSGNNGGSNTPTPSNPTPTTPSNPTPTQPTTPTEPTPAEPTQPAQPAEPNQPDQPAPTTPDTVPTIRPIETPSDLPDNTLNDLTIPGSDLLDSDLNLFYTDPLGVVAYVPNSGVISNTLAPLFEQYFAQAVLSQGFVITVLLIFSGSFATYFSLRKYADLATVTRKVPRRTPQMPKNYKSIKAAKTTTATKTNKNIKSNKTTRKAKK